MIVIDKDMFIECRDDEATLSIPPWEFHYGWDYKYRHGDDAEVAECDDWGFWVKDHGDIVFEVSEEDESFGDCDGPVDSLLFGIAKFLETCTITRNEVAS